MHHTFKMFVESPRNLIHASVTVFVTTDSNLLLAYFTMATMIGERSLQTGVCQLWLLVFSFPPQLVVPCWWHGCIMLLGSGVTHVHRLWLSCKEREIFRHVLCYISLLVEDMFFVIYLSFWKLKCEPLCFSCMVSVCVVNFLFLTSQNDLRHC